MKAKNIWNILAIASFVLAFIIASTGLEKLDQFHGEKRRPGLIDMVKVSEKGVGVQDRWKRHEDGSWYYSYSQIAEEERDDVTIKNPASENTIEVGVLVVNAYEADLSDPSYFAKGYIWLKWPEKLQEHFDKIGSDISTELALVNGLVSDAEAVLENIGDDRRQNDDGTFEQLFTFEGRFFISLMDLRRFPFMHMNLEIVLAPRDLGDDMYDFEHLRFRPNFSKSGVGNYTDLQGWNRVAWSISEYKQTLNTNYLDSDQKQDAHSQAIFSIMYKTSAYRSFWRLMLPLSIVMSMVILTFKIHPEYQDGRIALLATLLLTLVVLQESYQGEIPKLPFLSYLDTVYIFSFGATLASFVGVLYGAYCMKRIDNSSDSSERLRLANRVAQIDSIFPPVIIVSTIAVLVLAWRVLPGL